MIEGGFDEMYRARRDPWQFETSPYEQARYDTVVGWLGDRHYRRCFEPACSIGVLTERLTRRAAQVVACDVSPTAIDAARLRLDSAPGVEVLVAGVPGWWPPGTFDLVVLSELGYYFEPDELGEVARLVVGALEVGATVVAAHWLGTSADHVLHGREVHDILRSVLGPTAARADVIVDGPERSFTIERWRR